MNSDSKEIEELSDGWVRCRSKSNPGRQYYFNRKTGKSSWTQPQTGEKLDHKAIKKQPPKQKPENRHSEETSNKTIKRKSDGSEAGSSKKKHKNETPEKHSKASPKQAETKAKHATKNKSPTKPTSNKTPSKRRSLNESVQKVTPTNKKDSTPKVTPSKNVASKRLSELRAQLNVEASNEEEIESTFKTTKNDSTPDSNETTVTQKTELSSPKVSDSISSITTKSPSSDSLHFIPSSSQFFAANKIICSMKSYLPDQYSDNEKPKDTFADIEQGICNQMAEYPIIKHPSTPPQFSEASKLVSAIKSKLNYSPRDIKTFSSAQDRMEALRASMSGELDEQDVQSASLNDTRDIKAHQSLIPDAINTSRSEAMDVEESMEVEDVKQSTEAPAPSCHSKDNDLDNGQAVLVVDTNIFIHELDFVKNVLDSHIKGYSEQPMLLVPWRVINELDRLKDNNNGNGAICKRARAAMDYLYKCLPENSRIKGQSLRDANSHIYPCELPDDEILNCALQQAERGRNVLLLSNDRNLCNKASVNGIKRYGVVELRPLLERPPPRAGPELLARLRQCQHAVYQLLANILENEMRAKYNNLWLHVLFKAPPWRLADVLQCLLKHWIAVFNEVFPRIEHLISGLMDTHERIEAKDPKNLTESDVTNFKELCLDVAQKCQIIPEYMELAKLTVDRLKGRASETDDERVKQVVVGAFEALWVVMSSYCAKLATALGIPHSVEDTIPASETLINLTGKFAEFNGGVLNFISTIKAVLNIEDTSSMDEKVTRLEAAFRECLQLTGHDSRPTRDHLRTFSVTNRNMLQEAMNKFAQLGQLLDACKEKLQPPIVV